MPLSRDTVRRMGSSTFNYWFGYVANATLVMWLLSHAWRPAPGAAPMGAWPWLGYGALGLLGWTLAEYLLHRLVYHAIPSPLSLGHDLHHRAPRELIGVPWWLTTVLVVGLFRGLARLGAPGPVGVTLGALWAGYIGYCLLHHGSHHWRMGSGYLRAMKQHHHLHHAHPDSNWGFTTPLWDILLGTYRGRAKPRALPRPWPQT